MLFGMNPTTLNGPQKKSLPHRTGLISWWPVMAGVVVTYLALNLLNTLALTGHSEWFLRILFPYALLLRQPELGLSEELGNSLSQLMMYAQFPMEGLLMKLTMRKAPVFKSLMQVASIHVIVLTIVVILIEFVSRVRLVG
jgi:hypothetical protein